MNTEYGEIRFPVQILCFMMMLNIIKIWKRWKILRFYEFTRAEGYLGSSNSNFIVIVIASSVWILVQWFNGSNKKEELSWDKTKTKTKSRYSPPQPQKKPLTSALTEEEDEQFGNCILRLNTLLAIVLQIVQQNLMFRKLWCEEPVRILHSCELSLTVLERNCRAVTLEDSRKLYPSLVRCGQCQGERGEVFWPCWPVSASVRPDHRQFRAALLRDPGRQHRPRHEHPVARHQAGFVRHHQYRWVK